MLLFFAGSFNLLHEKSDMASIRKRVNSKGETRYTAQIRVKGRPSETATFKRKTDAERWAQHVRLHIKWHRISAALRESLLTFC